jgi:tRNA A37 threonylcarbamoyladenosine synthetase subunit TsaC/SUA5/YrdC
MNSFNLPMFSKRAPYSVVELAQMTKDIEKHIDMRAKSKLNSEYNNASTIIDCAQKVLQYMLEANEQALK